MNCSAPGLNGLSRPLALIALLFMTPGATAATVLRVDSRVAPDAVHDGQSWTTAFPTVQDALAVAAPGDAVWVAAGRYRVTPGRNFTVPSGVRLYGGFAGTEEEESQRDPARHVTVLDGNNVFLSVVSFAEGASADTRLEGFRIQNGRALGGGGIYCKGGAPVIARNVITGNTAINSGCGIFCEDSSAQIVGNTICGNIDTPMGGGIRCVGGAPVIEDNRIHGNVAIFGAGISCDRSAAVIRRNLILGNRAAQAGGGIECLNSPALIENNRIIGNVVQTLIGGGGIVGSGTPGPRILNNLIYANVLSPSTLPASGAGVLILGEATLHHNTILRNEAPPDAAAVEVRSPTVEFVNNLVAFNSSGVRLLRGVVWRHNCVFGHNGKDYLGALTPAPGDGNLVTDPRLIENALTAQVHLHPSSPCRDAGDASVVPEGAVDLDGEPRRQGAGVDIGCDESDGVTADFPARVVRVSPAGDNSHDGSSWALALRSVQAAVDTLAGTGGEVWVAAGVYPEQVTVRPLVHLFGGFRGEETTRAERNWRLHASVLDGQGAGPVVTLAYLDRFASLDGLVIRGGKAVEGGGVLCRVFSGDLRHNTLQDNVAARGGGLAILDSSSPTVEGNRFINNLAVHDPTQFPNQIGGHGGGLFLDTAPAEILNNLFLSNAATASVFVSRPGPGGGPAGSGGGMYIGLPLREPPWGQSRSGLLEALIANNTLLHNRATATDGQTVQEHGGGIRFEQGALVVNNLIGFNSSGVKTVVSGHANCRHNCVFGNGRDWVAANSTGQFGNFSADPLLVSNDDFHLQADSPCRDAGDSEVVRLRWRDLDGERRVQGLAVDIGADEALSESPRRNYYEDWAATHFAGQNDPALVGPQADQDGDGLANLVEFAFALAPTEPHPAFAPLRLLRLADAPGRLVVEFTRPSGILGITYEVERSTDLVNWQPLASPTLKPVVTLEGIGAATVRFGGTRGLSATSTNTFFRLRVSWGE